MRHRTSTLLFAAAWLVMAAAVVAGEPEKLGAPQKSGAPERQADKAASVGHPVSLTVRPESIRLAGPRAMRQVLVTGRYRDGNERDLTSLCEYRSENPGLVNIARSGLVTPQAAGETALVIEAGQQTARVPVVVTDFDKPQPVSFRREFIAALNVAGCNAGACHGIPSGRGGFKLSLRGYDPAADFLELTHAALGRRTNRFDAQASLILKKGIGLVAH